MELLLEKVYAGSLVRSCRVFVTDIVTYVYKEFITFPWREAGSRHWFQSSGRDQKMAIFVEGERLPMCTCQGEARKSYILIGRRPLPKRLPRLPRKV